MKNLNTKQKFVMSLGIGALCLGIFTLIAFLYLNVPFKLDTLLNFGVLSLALAGFLLVILAMNSWILILFFGLGLIASYWAYIFTVQKTGVESAPFNALFIWIVVMISMNAVGILLHMLRKTKAKAKEALKIAEEEAKQKEIEYQTQLRLKEEAIKLQDKALKPQPVEESDVHEEHIAEEDHFNDTSSRKIKWIDLDTPDTVTKDIETKESE